MTRIIGLALTGVSLLYALVFAVPPLILTQLHSRADSEGGIFAHGIGFLVNLTISALGVLVGCTLWGAALRAGSGAGSERRTQRTLLTLALAWLAFVAYWFVDARAA